MISPSRIKTREHLGEDGLGIQARLEAVHVTEAPRPQASPIPFADLRIPRITAGERAGCVAHIQLGVLGFLHRQRRHPTEEVVNDLGVPEVRFPRHR
jgi:hypothetical protein